MHGRGLSLGVDNPWPPYIHVLYMCILISLYILTSDTYGLVGASLSSQCDQHHSANDNMGMAKHLKFVAMNL